MAGVTRSAAGTVRQHFSDGHYELTTMAEMLDLTRPESLMVRVESPDRPTLPGQILDQRDCTPLLDHLNRILALPRKCILLTQTVQSVSTSCKLFTICGRGCGLGPCTKLELLYKVHGVGPHQPQQWWHHRLTSQWSVGGRSSYLKPGKCGHQSCVSKDLSWTMSPCWWSWCQEQPSVRWAPRQWILSSSSSLLTQLRAWILILPDKVPWYCLHWDDDISPSLRVYIKLWDKSSGTSALVWCHPTANIIHILQTRFETQLQGQRFKAELRARRRAPGEALQLLSGHLSTCNSSIPICWAFINYPCG